MVIHVYNNALYIPKYEYDKHLRLIECVAKETKCVVENTAVLYALVTGKDLYKFIVALSGFCDLTIK